MVAIRRHESEYGQCSIIAVADTRLNTLVRRMVYIEKQPSKHLNV